MELTEKTFDELSTAELFDIYRLRCSVFIVEQQCPYQDIDEHDRRAIHLCLREGGVLLAYLRVLPQGTVFPEASLGRVISVRRRCGLGSKIVAEGIRLAEERFHAESLRIEAQTYARGLYEKQGFRQCSEEFSEDGIPHIQMLRKRQ